MKANEPGITVQIIGFEYGLYPGGGNHFILLRMGDGLPDVLYTESLQERDDTTDAGKLRSAGNLWDNLRAVALSPRSLLQNRTQDYIARLSYLMPPHSISHAVG